MKNASPPLPLDGQSQSPSPDPQRAKKFKSPGHYTKGDRDKIPAEDFAGPNQTFPIVTPKDVHDAAGLHGHAADPEAVKSKIISIAKRKGPEFVARLPDDWKPGGSKEERMATAVPAKTAVFYAPITRQDAEKWEVEGIMTSEAVDSYGTIFDYDSMKSAVERWRGNIREQHDPKKAVGTRVHVSFDDEKKQVWLRAKISRGAPDTWAKIEDGVLQGFSIGAYNIQKTERRQVEVNGQSKTVPVYKDYDLAEVSVVDSPSNGDAELTSIYRSKPSVQALIYRSAALSETGQEEDGEVFDPYEDETPEETREETPETPETETLEVSETPEVPSEESRAAKSNQDDSSDGDGGSEDEEENETEDEGQQDDSEDDDTPPAKKRSEDLEIGLEGHKMVALAEVLRAAEDAMLSDSGHTHDHDHPHQSSYGDAHLHDHSHQHEDGTSHSHQHMHAHEHHDHFGQEDHAHPHSHAHDHDHNFRMIAPDLQRDQLPQPEEGVPSWYDRLLEQESRERAKKKTPPPTSEENHQGGQIEDSDDGPTAEVAGENPEDDDENSSEKDGKKRAITTETGLSGHDLSTPAQVVVPDSTRAAHGGPGCTCSDGCDCPAGCTCERCKDCALTRSQTPSQKRAGARISKNTQGLLHQARDAQLLSCNCQECQDMMEAAGGADPDGDGDDDSTPEGDTDHDYQSERSARLQRIRLSQTVRDVVREVLSVLLERHLEPVVQRQKQVTARLASIQSPDLTRVTDQLDKVEASQEAQKGLFEQMAKQIDMMSKQEMPGLAPVLNPAHKAMPFSRAATMDASVPQNPELSPDQMAEVYRVLQQRGLLGSQESQVDAAAAILTRQFSGR